MARRILLAAVGLAELLVAAVLVLCLLWVNACRSTWPEPIRAEIAGAYTTTRLDGSLVYWLELRWVDAAGVNQSRRLNVPMMEYHRWVERAECCLYEWPGGHVVLRECR